MGVKKNVSEYIDIAFMLLAVLLGFILIAVMIGFVGESSNSSIPQESATVLAETGGFINSSGYRLSNTTVFGANNFVILAAYNATLGTINAANYTVSSSGIVTNVSTSSAPGIWTAVIFNYTYTRDSNIELQSKSIQNGSLAGINTYAQGATTQFSTILIAIIIAILIGLFYLFYSNFISKRNARRSGNGNAIFRQDNFVG